MAEGTVKSFDEQKGFGFIVDESGKEFTFNKNSLESSGSAVQAGDRVGFDIEQGARGSRAVRIKKL